MRTAIRAAVAAMAMTITLGVAGGVSADAAEPGLESQFVSQLNGVRANAGLPPLTVDGELTAVARGWADNMASQNTIFHNPNLGGSVSAPWSKLGENVGTGYEVTVIMQAFVDSSAHYRNIVDADFDYVGVGVTWGSDGRMYTAHVFMDIEASPAPAPEPTPAVDATDTERQTAPTPAAASAPTPAAPEVPAPTPPPAAAAPERVAAVLTLVGNLGGGLR